ncbi:CobW family GTP-binding protein [Chitinophaga sp. Ak27]|uniref:CobW family GTP-binding protein n=1 Tax=Chitinophaga sp. Ak27 TaxID=2726116 RepID=UPI00145CD0A1|nr:GTP-binding protein [Chitinophaga sp. Ak27]NLU92149.1 GTP-binding protein [Chitinophaga sp. Ak27]
MERDKRIKVYIITGFLGAGKTTILNSLLQQFTGSRNVVIENEVGKVNIDASLIDAKIDQLYELTSGCICCSLDNDLLEVLGNILGQEQRPDHVFIETTGIADTGNIIGMFHIPDVQRHYKLECTVCVVDAENIFERLQQAPEAGKQVAAADVIIVNKIQQLPVPQLVYLSQQLEQMNPLAFITTSEKGSISLKDLQFREKPLPAKERTAPLKQPHKINTVLFESPIAFDLNMFVFVLDFYCNAYPEQLYRIKGYIRVCNSKEKMLVQSTGRYLHIVSAGEWEDESPSSTLVFIGRELKSATIQRILAPAQKEKI